MNSKFMEEAINQAKIAFSKGEVPIGAVIVKKGEIIAVAHNLCEELSDATAHAEMLCIKKAAEKLGNFRLKDTELYVTLEPCPMCAGAAMNARIDEIIFGAFDPQKGALGSVTNLYSFGFPNKPTVYSGIRERECLDLLQQFFKRRRNSSNK